MTCHDARERLSAYLDDALAPDERRDVAAHLEGCAECRRELARLDATVALLRRVEPARAPVGFVDRVVEAARPRPGTGARPPRSSCRSRSSCRPRPPRC